MIDENKNKVINWKRVFTYYNGIKYDNNLKKGSFRTSAKRELTGNTVKTRRLAITVREI